MSTSVTYERTATKINRSCVHRVIANGVGIGNLNKFYEEGIRVPAGTLGGVAGRWAWVFAPDDDLDDVCPTQLWIEEFTSTRLAGIKADLSRKIEAGIPDCWEPDWPDHIAATAFYSWLKARE